MPGWSLIPQSAGDANWASASGPWAELYAAYNERRAVLGSGAATAPSAGVVIADKDWIEDIQSWIESNCEKFVATIDSGGSPITDYDGESHIELWTWEKIKARVLGGRGWYRKNETGTNENRQDAGWWASYIGLMNDLRLVLNELVWTTRYLINSYNHGIISNVDLSAGVWKSCDPIDRYYGGGGYDPLWEDSKADAEAAWSPAATDATGPCSYSYGVRAFTSSKSANLNRSRQNIQLTGVPNTFNCRMDSYIRASVRYNDESVAWDDNGDAVIQDTWVKFDADVNSGGSTTITSSVSAGDQASSIKPNWCSEPGYNSRSFRGWIAFSEGGSYGSGAAILRWNVSGGFEYY